MTIDLTDSLEPSYIELEEEALIQNISFLKNELKPGVTLSAVIKGNAYGHGISTFMPMAERAGIHHFSVFSAQEARVVLNHRVNKETRIMIMGMIRDREVKWAIENGVEFYLFEKDRLKVAIEQARQLGSRAKIHLQLETGMNRTGFEAVEWKEVFEIVKSHPEQLTLCGICTHYAGAESVANHYRIQNQDKQFRESLNRAEAVFGKKPPSHAASSAAFLTFPEFQYDMVRVGIALYGFWPSRETYMGYARSNDLEADHDPLKRVISWKSEVMNTKWVEEGEFIGYGDVYMAGRQMKIATVPIGYTHGFGRNLTNTGYVLIRGLRALVVGIVNMNMITVDVTDINGAKKGDEVVLIGRQEGDEITVASFGEMTNNLNYEVLTRLPSSIPRIWV